MSSKYFSSMEIDTIGEILNISLGASATAVSTMLNTRVDITTPIVNVVTKEEFEMDKVEPAVGVEITYVCGLEGSNIMLLKRHDVKVIVEMLMGISMSDEEFELNEMNVSAVCEVMNQMMGASSTALSEFLGKMVNISTPVSFEVKDEEEFVEKYFTDDKPKVVVGFTLKIADKLESEFYNVMPIQLAKSLVKGFLPEDSIIDVERMDSVSAETASEPTEPEASSGGMMSQEEIEKLLAGADEPQSSEVQSVPEPQSQPSSSGGKLSQEEIEKLLAGASDPETSAEPEPQPIPVPQAAPEPIPAPQTVAQQPVMQTVSPDVSMMQMQMMQQMMQQMQQMQQKLEAKQAAPPEPKMINVQSASHPSLNPSKDMILAGEQEENMELIMGVPLEISVEIGRTKKYVKDILDFTKGSLVVLDKLAGEQVELFVNGQCIAKGDVVVVEDNFGVRITEIMKINLASLE